MRQTLSTETYATDDVCSVCSGSGLLLEDPCPLCCDDGVVSDQALGAVTSKLPVAAPVLADGEYSILRELPDNWLECVDGQGAFFLNTVTQEVTLPAEVTGAPVAAVEEEVSVALLPAPFAPQSPLCLVLDIDGTMLAESARVSPASMRSWLRPHLAAFLDFAFASFRAVAIWTAGSQEWLDAFLSAVDPAGSRPWAFAWSYSRISWLRLEGGASDDSPATLQHVKRLSKIWKSSALRAKGFLPHTTLIVDNNPAVCLASYGNAIYIKTYGDAPDHASEESDSDDDGIVDDWLLVLMEYLTRLSEAQVPGRTVRHIDKRGWYSDTKEAGMRQRAHTA